ncbi:MAG: InlB B-repeat-containing protein [Pseudomonadota bacterium]
MGTKDVFAAKLDASGNVLWAKNFGGSGAELYGMAMAIDSGGNVVVSGLSCGASPTTPALTKIGNCDAFVIRLNASGAITWAKNFGGSGASAYARAIAVDGSGNVVVAGNFEGASLTTPALSKIGIQDAFAIKLDANSGNISWVKNFGGSSATARAHAVAVDGSGNVVLAGLFFNGNLTTPALTKFGDFDAFVIKLDANGNTSWSRNYGGSDVSYMIAEAVAIDGAGNVVLGGTTYSSLTTPLLPIIGDGDAFVIKLNSTGTTLWAKSFGGSGAYASAKAIAVDGSGNIVLGGSVQGASLTTPALTTIGAADAFAIKLDANGATKWASNFGGSGALAHANAIAVDGSGNLVLAGGFQFGNLSAPQLTRNGIQDALIIKQFPHYTLAYSAGSHGSISGTSAQTVGYGVEGSAVTAVPDANCHFVNWNDGSTTNPRTDSNINVDVTANFAINTYTLSYVAGAHGSISGVSPQIVNYDVIGSAVTAMPAAHYHFVSWSDGSSANPRTDSNINVNVTANFAIDTYTLSYVAGANGSISGISPQTVNYGANGSAVTAVPATNYHFVNWSDAVTANPRTDSNTNVNVTANFAINTLGVIYDGNTSSGGTVPVDVALYFTNDNVTVRSNTGNLVKTGYFFAGWNTAADGSGTASSAGSSLTVGLANVTLYAQWIQGASFSYAGAAIPIPDGTVESDGAEVGASIAVVGLSGAVSRVTLSIDGTTCNTTDGSTAVGIDHTYVGDLRITLRSPTGTEVVVINQIGTFGKNFCQIVLDDFSAGPSIQDANAAAAPFSGSWKPSGLLSAFVGEFANGTWTLLAQDIYPGDTGSLRAWTINIATSPAHTVAYHGNGNTSGTVPVDAGLYAAGATVTVLANTGNLAKTGYAFGGWNTAANGSGAAYVAGSSFAMGAANVSLYAKWIDPQTIIFGAQSARLFGAAPFTLNPLATASSALAVIYSSATPVVCTVAGSTITLLRPGTCSISADQPGNASVGQAPKVTQSFRVNGTLLTASRSKISPKQAVTFTATVIGAAPTGNVNFKDGATSIIGCASQPVVSGVATCATALSLGVHSIGATYSGDGSNPASNAQSIGVTVQHSSLVPVLELLLF